MKSKPSPFLIGTFVVGGLLLGFVALLSFRSLNPFSKPARFVAYFNESVQGLDVGSPVKLRGVRVGRVVTIRILHDPKARQSQVAVVGELEEGAISDGAGKEIKVGDRATFERLVDEGLRAKVDMAGITGLQFVELDFFDPREFPAPRRDGAEGYPIVPTLRSGMSELVANLSKIASNLNAVDFPGLARELQALFATVNRQVGDVDLQQLAARLSGAASSIDALAGSAETKEALANLGKAAAGVHGLVGRLDAQVEPVQAELVRALRSFHDAAEGVGNLMSPQTGLGGEAVLTLQQVGDAAESLQSLADFLERNPSALLTGKKRPDKGP